MFVSFRAFSEKASIGPDGHHHRCLILCIVSIPNRKSWFEGGLCSTVSYDHRAIVIDGKRRVLLSGSVHYPRATPEMWPDIIRRSKEGGLDVIETYVFWNYHEPVRGQYYFEDRFDLVRFVKEVQEAGLLVHLRIGPYACAEWNYGGFPMWLHFLPGIQFRTDNAIFKNEMKRFLVKIVNLMKEEQLFASQGGPIILAQVENEYGNVQSSYGEAGDLYVQWSAKTAVSLNTTVPWVMCAQNDAPDPVRSTMQINTCNGFYCDGFTPNSPSKPKMWTENYSGWFLSFGYPIPYRPVEDLAFSVARFFAYGGTFQNYYMYFGGTNFGRTAGGPMTATSYDYDAPLDEYGFIRQPKWGHLRDLHKAIKLCEEHLISSDPVHQSLGHNLEAHIYYKSSNSSCAAFLSNFDSKSDAKVEFKGNEYFLPAWSVSILPDCKNVAFNTAKVVSQRHPIGNSFTRSNTANEVSLARSSAWSWYQEQVGIWGNSSFTESGLLEQINTTKDTSDFLWYSTSIYANSADDRDGLLNIQSLGHAALVYVNKKLIGIGYGNHDDEKFSITQKISLDEGKNTLDILSMIVGLQNYGPMFDVKGAGIDAVVLAEFKNGNRDISSGEWTYQVGLKGEEIGLEKVSLGNSSYWDHGGSVPVAKSLIWYKTTFLAPQGTGPLVLNLTSMGKGQAWVNGKGIGRYWPAYLSPPNGCTDNCDYRGKHDSSTCQRNCGQPTQTLYHVPRAWVQPGENLLVLHELGGDPTKISVLARTSEEIVCSVVSEDDPPPLDSWKSSVESSSGRPEVRVSCEEGSRIYAVNFASFGNPEGNCGSFVRGECHVDVLSLVRKSWNFSRVLLVSIMEVEENVRQCSNSSNPNDQCPGNLETAMGSLGCQGVPESTVVEDSKPEADDKLVNSERSECNGLAVTDHEEVRASEGVVVDVDLRGGLKSCPRFQRMASFDLNDTLMNDEECRDDLGALAEVVSEPEQKVASTTEKIIDEGASGDSQRSSMESPCHESRVTQPEVIASESVPFQLDTMVASRECKAQDQQLLDANSSPDHDIKVPTSMDADDDSSKKCRDDYYDSSGVPIHVASTGKEVPLPAVPQHFVGVKDGGELSRLDIGNNLDEGFDDLAAGVHRGPRGYLRGVWDYARKAAHQAKLNSMEASSSRKRVHDLESQVHSLNQAMVEWKQKALHLMEHSTCFGSSTAPILILPVTETGMPRIDDPSRLPPSSSTEVPLSRSPATRFTPVHNPLVDLVRGTPSSGPTVSVGLSASGLVVPWRLDHMPGNGAPTTIPPMATTSMALPSLNGASSSTETKRNVVARRVSIQDNGDDRSFPVGLLPLHVPKKKRT
ncbi:Beta-galactosidase 8 [Linum perenne]